MASRNLTRSTALGNRARQSDTQKGTEAGAVSAIFQAHPSLGLAPFFAPKRDSPDTRRWVLGQIPAAQAPHSRLAPDRTDNPPLPPVVYALTQRPAPDLGVVLDNYTDNVSALVGTKCGKRRHRFKLRAVVQRYTKTKRVAKCGVCRVAPSVGIHLTEAGGVAYYSGILSCGSVWVCPVCSAKLEARRAAEVYRVLKAQDDLGGGAYMGTFTLPHHKGQSLKKLLKFVANGFRLMGTSRAWRTLKKRLGIIGFIRALELTYGGNGWHPHLHTLWLTERPLTASEREELDAFLFAAWRKAVVKQGHPAPQRDGFDFAPVLDVDSAARYVTKMGAALELTHGLQKQGKSGHRIGEHRTPFQILSDFLETGDEADLKLWQEYEAAIFNARRLTWAKGLKARFAVAEVSDEDLAAEDVGGPLQADLSPVVWRNVVTHRKQLELLEAAERGGVAAIWRVINALPAPPPPLPPLRPQRSDTSDG